MVAVLKPNVYSKCYEKITLYLKLSLPRCIVTDKKKNTEDIRSRRYAVK